MKRGAAHAWFCVPVTIALLTLGTEGCDDASPDSSRDSRSEAVEASKPVDPPFAVEDDCEDLMLVWFDEEGAHTAQSRKEIPEGHRRRVRVESLKLPPKQRLGPAWVYVADLREPADDGEYPVVKMRRSAFDELVDAAASGGGGTARNAQSAGSPGGDTVVVYGAEWCGACDKVEQFLNKRGVSFVEKNIEDNPKARAEMKRKAREAGVPVGGIPVIDFRGTLIQGFNRARLERLIQQTRKSI